ncbi:MAG: DUF4203 domain-containing protein [Eubacteriales bacterium]|nr:DUF4203 domain-containing protein [Eubacteriales bacterium]
MDTGTLAIIMLVAYLAVGIVFCFFGNRWLKVIVAVYGFVAGYMLAGVLVPMLFSSLSDTVVLLISLGVGVVGALLFVFLIYVGIFFIGFGGGVLLSLLLIDVFNLNLFDWYVYIPVLVISCIFGSLTLNRRRIFISIFTSFIGASAIAQFIYQVAGGIKPETMMLYYDQQATYSAYSSLIYIISLVVLFFAGLVVQLAVTSKKKT